MNQKDIEQIGYALFLAGKQKQQIDPPSVKYPEITYEDAYAIQKELVKNMMNDGYTISGKKVGLTSNAMRKVANIFEPDYGYIFNEVCYPNDVELPMSQFIEPRIECELAFMLKEDLLGKKISKEDVLNATDYIVCCIEICDFRIFREKHKRVIQDSISDNAAFGAYVLGDKPIKPDEYNLMMVPFVFEYNNKQIETSCGAAVYNDPALSVAWLAERFSELGNPLRKGEMILSGSAVASVNVKANDHLRCAFGPFGEVRCSFI